MRRAARHDRSLIAPDVTVVCRRFASAHPSRRSGSLILRWLASAAGLHAHRLAFHLRVVRRVRRLAQTMFTLVALGPLEEWRDVDADVVDAGVQVAQLR